MTSQGETSQGDLSLSQIEKKARSLLVFANAKAGTKEAERARINKVLYESSKNSAYFQNEERKAVLVEAKLKRIKDKVSAVQQKTQARGIMNDLQRISTERMVQKLKEQINFFHTWIHIDMDMFYAAVEIRDNPALKDKPVAIGGMGMISTANYVARGFGVRSAMPGFMGRKLCPSLVFVRPNFEKYTKVANQVREILVEYDEHFEAMSLDEASLDVTEYINLNYDMLKQRLGDSNQKTACAEGASKDGIPCSNNKCDYSDLSASKCDEYGRIGAIIAEDIRRKIRVKTFLTASAGVACTRTLAKICSDLNKPDGMYHLPTKRDSLVNFMAELNVRKLPGVGKVMERVLNELGISKCRQILGDGAPLILEYFSKKTSDWLFRAATGVCKCRCTKAGPSKRKGIGNERTFKAMSDPKKLRQKCIELCHLVGSRMKRTDTVGKCLTLKLKDTKFVVHTRSATLDRYICKGDDLANAALPMLENEITKARKVGTPLTLRLMGVRMSTLICRTGESMRAPSFFHSEDNAPKPTRTTNLNGIEQFLSKKRPRRPDDKVDAPRVQKRPTKIHQKRRNDTDYRMSNSVDLRKGTANLFRPTIRSQASSSSKTGAPKLRKEEYINLPGRTESLERPNAFQIDQLFDVRSEPMPPRMKRTLHAASEIDPSVFAELPEDIRKEITKDIARKDEKSSVSRHSSAALSQMPLSKSRGACSGGKDLLAYFKPSTC